MRIGHFDTIFIEACILRVHLHDGCSGQRRSSILSWRQVERQADGIPALVFIERTVLESDGNRIFLRLNAFIKEELVDQLRVVAHVAKLTEGSHLLEFKVAIHIF